MGATTEDGWVSTQVITSADVKAFSAISGDYNSVHQGPDAIVHGALLISKVSAMAWQTFGDGTIAREIDNFEVLRPIRPGEEFNISLTRPVPVERLSKLGVQLSLVKITKWHKGKEKVVAEGQLLIIPGNKIEPE